MATSRNSATAVTCRRPRLMGANPRDEAGAITSKAAPLPSCWMTGLPRTATTPSLYQLTPGVDALAGAVAHFQRAMNCRPGGQGTARRGDAGEIEDFIERLQPADLSRHADQWGPSADLVEQARLERPLAGTCVKSQRQGKCSCPNSSRCSRGWPTTKMLCWP